MSVSDGTLTIVAKNQSVMEKVLEKVDFILGREIEIGGIYKGRVSSIKEYGAFVEFNGGQQGLLHISELSHEPVSWVSDVVSIGQQLSLICIGQDVRGNIKLSLKATLPRPRFETNNVVEESVSSTKEAPSIWAAAGDLLSNGQQNQSSMSEKLPSKYEAGGINASTSSSPPILIRSAAECDEEEKSAGLVQNSKATSRPVGASETDHKPKTFRQDSPVLAKSDLQTINDKISKSFSQKEGDKTEVRSPVTAKTLKIGTKVTAKVYQIRTRGLVLDLGGGIRGMYRFETNGENDFEVNDELRVVCTSFSGKGIPVMSLVNDE